MADAVNLDWSLAQPKEDFAGDYANAFALGRQMAQQKGQAAAGALYAADPTAGANAMMAYNPELGMTMTKAAQGQQDRQASVAAATAAAGGDLPGAARALAGTGNIEAVMQLNDAQRAQALQTAQQAAGALNSLLTIKDPNERLAYAKAIATTKPSLKIDPNSLTLDSVSDQSITAQVAGVETLQQQLEEADKTRTFNETHRHNLAEEGKPQYEEVKNPDGSTSQVLVNPGAVSAAQGAQAAPAAAAAPRGPVKAGPGDLDAMTRAMIGEAGGEGPGGMAAVGHVILNRAAAAPGTSIADLVHAPGAFQGLASPRAAIATSDPAYQHAYQIAQQVAGGQIADPTGGATHFLNPELQAQQGNPMPPWAQGPGQRIGNQVFYGGSQPQGAPAPASAAAPGPASAGGAAPYQVASTGPTPPPPSGGAPAGAPGAPAAGATIGGTPSLLTGGAAAQAPGDPSKTGDAYLATLDPATKAEVQAMLDGRMIIPSGSSLRSPAMARLVAAAALADPSFDQANAHARAITRASFAGGKGMQQNTNLNTVIGHLGDLSDAIAGLHNGKIPLGNWAGNSFSQAIGEDPVARFDAAKTVIADDLTSALRGGGGAEADVQGWLKQLDSSKSPDQLNTVVKEMVNAIAKRVNALGDAYAQGMGITRDGMTLIHPEAASTMARLGGQNAQEALDKATYYQSAEAHGMPSRLIDGGWQRYAAAHAARYGHASAPAAPAGQGGWKVLGVQ